MGRILGTRITTAVGAVEAAVAGSGPAVVLVHGLPGSWRQLVPLAEDLAADHTVVLPSRPGYGATPLTTGRTYDEHAAAYSALLDALGISRAAIVGVSGGGPSAAAFAATRPDRTTALVLACPLAPDRIRIPRGIRLAALPGVGEAASAVFRARRRRQLAQPDALERLIRSELSPAELKGLDDTVRADMVRFFRSHLDAPSGLAGLRNDVAQARGATPFSRPVSAPTLVIHGDADAVVPLDHARAYAAAIPGSTLEIIEGASHGFLLTRRAEVVPRLADFIALRETA
jgi:2-hydroxy-6-oxonona-2,4-dienedioate hydrolase